MKIKKMGLFIVLILFLAIISIGYTHSKLNITFTKQLSFESKDYNLMSINNTVQLDTNSYKITLANNNNYNIEFVCEDIGANFSVSCSENVINANSTIDIIVDLDFKADTNISTLTPNPSGDGYITKIGIRMTSPYISTVANPYYSESGNMIVVELTVTNLKTHITTLANTDTTNLAKDHSINIRYIGANPNNYVTYNGETWRILGVFADGIKIIRTTPYNNTPYTFYDGSASGTNSSYKTATIKNELNNTFYDSINSKYKNMIKEGTWNVGAINMWAWQTAPTTYDTEKTDTVLANVGLISATDFVYAIGGSTRTSCVESTHIGDVGSCATNNWLKQYASTSGMWTLNKFSEASGYTIVATTSGGLANNGIEYTSAVYPVVYLKEDVGFTSGDGTSAKPYRLKSGTSEIAPTPYTDFIIDVYVNSWGNSLAGFAGKKITSFDRTDGNELFNTSTWGIPSSYTIDQVTVYSYNWAELATYYNRTWIEDSGWHARLSNYVFKRQVSPDLDYIGSSVLSENDGTLRYVIIVK